MNLATDDKPDGSSACALKASWDLQLMRALLMKAHIHSTSCSWRHHCTSACMHQPQRYKMAEYTMCLLSDWQPAWFN